MSASSPTIVWFRRDLRLHDNPAWNKAVESGKTIIPLYIHCDHEEGTWRRGSASRWWLHHALSDLDDQLCELGSQLFIINVEKNESSLEKIQKIITRSGADSVTWNRCYEPSFVKRDAEIKHALKSNNIQVESFNGTLLLDPHQIRNKSGSPFQVFTPFWKHCREIEIPKPVTAQFVKEPINKDEPFSTPDHTELEKLTLYPIIPWHLPIEKFWDATRSGGIELLAKLTQKSDHYQNKRDLPNDDATSRLSSYLHFGQISPQELYHHLHSSLSQPKQIETANDGIIRQLYWREFSAHLLYHFPHSQDTALKPKYDEFPWRLDENLLLAWQQGKTGFPIVDAGMRQLWETGWMHNRVRMIAGSLLVKHLLQPWQEGARWFWDTLVDADLANNSMGWQWVAGSGADASPYFRIFNPIIQGKKFDPDGSYVKKWCPELSRLPKQYIHCPWEASPIELRAAGITLDENYPSPIISHENGRKQALDAYAKFSGKSSSKLR